MNKKTSYIIIFSLLVVLTVGIIFTDYVKQLGTILADASVPNPGHSLSEIEGGQDLATKEYVDSAMTGTVRTSGDQIIGGIKTFSNTIVGTGIITNASGGTQPTCDASTRGLIWNEYGSSGQRDKLYICQKLSNNTYSFTFISEPACGYAFIDPRDSNIYPTVQIGDQCWMAKNIAYLPSVVGPGTVSITTPYYYVYGYDGTDVAQAKATTNYTTYGVLYNWPAALTACPASWHLPSDAEYKTLEMYLGMTQAQADATGYRGNDEGMKLITYNPGYNSSGFTALMAGYRSIQNGAFCNIGTLTDYWTSTADSTAAYWRHLELADVQVHRDSYNKGFGCSVRCLKN
jgi:uncharacterized protein (TIGR02145 family)